MTTRAQQHERTAAKTMGLKPTAASGSKTVKNDARADRDGRAYPESAEYKTTGNIYYRLHLDDLIKAARQGHADQRMPVFGVEFENAARGARPWRYIVLEESDYLELIGRIRELETETKDLQDRITFDYEPIAKD